MTKYDKELDTRTDEFEEARRPLDEVTHAPKDDRDAAERLEDEGETGD
jgi:hypothetical protein